MQTIHQAACWNVDSSSGGQGCQSYRFVEHSFLFFLAVLSFGFGVRASLVAEHRL